MVAGALVMNDFRFPNFLIIGAMKAGTTTLYRDLLSHPHVFFPAEKEPGHLASDHVLTEEGQAEYAALFAGARPDDVCGDASTNSSKLPDFPRVPHRSRDLLGSQLKLIYVVREPVARTISHHWYDHLLGYMPRHLESALDAHPELTAYSCYAMQLRAWLEYFDREQIHVIQFEEFVKHRQATVADCFRFLGLTDTAGQVDKDRIYNTSENRRIPRTAWLAGLQRSFFYQRVVRPLLPMHVKDAIWDVARKKDLPKPPPPSLVAVQRIVDAVASDVDALTKLLHRDQALWDLDAVLATFRVRTEARKA